MRILIALCLSLLLLGAKAKTPTLCKPEQACWPKEAAWKALNKRVNGHLMKVESPLKACVKNQQSKACLAALKQLRNPFTIETLPGATQSTGWYQAWKSAPSTYAVAVENAKEISEAVKFAKKHNIKLVIKGTGHDYLGRSNAPDSLLVWTHPMREVTVTDSFVPKGCGKTEKGIPAMTALAGTRWIEAYKTVSVDNNRYVQGGGCTSVGVAGGFLQGGGFGSWSKKFGMGASGLLEAEIITANGEIKTVNRCQNQDLFWALKGGGGGTFGVVSQVTLMTHPLPKTLGVLDGSIKAPNDKAFKQLIREFLVFYRDKLNNENFGEQVAIQSDNQLRFAMSFTALTPTQLDAILTPFKKHLTSIDKAYQVNFKPLFIPGNKFWDINYRSKHLPKSVVTDPNRQGFYWWTGNDAEVSIYLNYYLTSYIPIELFKEKNINQFADTLFQASRLNPNLILHFNKGQNGASNDALTRGKQTAMNAKVFNAVGLLIMAGGQQYQYPALTRERNPAIAKEVENANKAFSLIKQIAPDAGTYANEADYFEPNWAHSFWGENYKQLSSIKNKYDPDNFFYCHHCVGSD